VHEYSIVSALLERVEAEARSRRATAVHRVAVRVGEVSGLDRELFATAFATVREGTVCAAAALDIEAVPARFACSACELVVADGAPLVCAACGAPARLEQGDEILLERIEMEVPDV
jgi:hydrogenase nickel incorporation protein HypA/HybF